MGDEPARPVNASAYRPPEKPLPDCYSRHYYDVAMVAQGSIRAEALADLELLAQVVRQKEMFYPSGWARYDLARPGSFHLVPVQARLGDLAQDYRNMASMIFGEPPALDTIIETLAALEQEVNR